MPGCRGHVRVLHKAMRSEHTGIDGALLADWPRGLQQYHCAQACLLRGAYCQAPAWQQREAFWPTPMCTAAAEWAAHSNGTAREAAWPNLDNFRREQVRPRGEELPNLYEGGSQLQHRLPGPCCGPSAARPQPVASHVSGHPAKQCSIRPWRMQQHGMMGSVHPGGLTDGS